MEIKRSKTELFIGVFILLSTIVTAQIPIYPYRVEPAKFPDYERRSFYAPNPTESFNDTVRFVGSRYSKPTGENMFYGNFYRPNQGWILDQSYFDFVADISKMIKDNIGVFDPAGYGPGTPYTSGFGQKPIPDNKMEQLKRLGPLFIGNSLGEQDGRYWADERQLMEPYFSNPKKQHKIFLEYMRQNAKDYGYMLTQLTTFWGFHYTPKDGYISALGSECQNKDRVSQIQLQYAFNRGVSRQYGILTFGDISLFNTWGHKGNSSDPYGGNSFALMRRMLALQYQYNSWILGFEGEWGTVSDPKPIGKIQIGMHNLINKHLPQPGNLHVPVAFLMDFFSGWMPPYHGDYRRWGFLPYEKGQYLTHHMFNLIYPDYEDNGQNKDEVPAIVPNPLGDVDALLSDTHKELLLQYPLIIVSDELVTDINEVKTKLNYYVENGGNLILTAVNAKKIIGEEFFTDYEMINSGASIETDNGTITETNSFKLAGANISGSKTLYSVNGKPVVIEYAKGTGHFIISLSDYGLNSGNSRLLNHVKQLVSDQIKQYQLLTAGQNVTCSVNTIDNTHFLVGIYNNSLVQQDFDIQSNIGTITDISELSLGEDISQERGYKPNSGTVVFGTNSENTIQALDVRLFKVAISNPSITKLPEITYPTLPEKKYLSINKLNQLCDIISGYPHFFHHFTGVKISWDMIGNYENKAFIEDADWINHQKIGFIIDFTENFPLIDFRPENIITYHSLNQRLENLSANLKLIEGDKTIVLPEANNELESLALKELQKRCSSMEVTVISKSDKLTQDQASVYDGTANSIQNAGLVYVEPTDMPLDMKALGNIFSTTPVVIDYPVTDWDSIFNILQCIEQKTSLITGKYNTAVKDKNYRVQSPNQYKYIALHDIQSIRDEILNHQDDFFSLFGGIKIDGTYLWSRSEEACREEGRWLKSQNINVVVDLLRELNHYPDLTWTKELSSYSRSKSIMEDILSKMVLLGSKDIIIGSHMRCEWWKFSYSNETSIKNGMKEFINAAEEKGITVHIQHREHQNYPGRLLASPSDTKNLVNSFTGTKFAANLGIVSDPSYLKNTAGNKLGLVILAYKGDAGLDIRNPINQGMYNGMKPDYSPVTNLTIPMILDAEYNGWNEVLLDCNAIGWTQVNLY